VHFEFPALSASMENHLPQYSQLRHHITAIFNPRSEIQIIVEPGDEVAQLVAELLVDDAWSDERRIDALQICIDSGDRQGCRWAPPEISELQLKDPKDGVLSVGRQGDGTTICFKPAEGWTPQKGIRFTCQIWEAIRPPVGIEPYTQSELCIWVSCLSCTSKRLVITVVTPAAATPRSTQGTFHLAYPSRVQQQLRRTLIFYDRIGAALRYRFGRVDTADLPWIIVLKGALALGVAAALAWFPKMLAPNADQTKNIVLLVTALASYILYINDLVTRGLRVDIYKTITGSLMLVALVSGLVVTATYGWITYALLVSAWTASTAVPSGHAANLDFPYHFRIGILVLTFASLLIMAVGMYTHTLGTWHGYRCDMSRCAKRFLFRRGRRECKYTGRVPCRACIKKICVTCPHYSDLEWGGLETAHKYQPTKLPCIRDLG
jgi:hypothetical protein